MIGDRAYDCDPLDQRLLQKHRIRLIAPHKYNFAWLHNFRRLVSRWEHQEANFLGMLQLACFVILARHL